VIGELERHRGCIRVLVERHAIEGEPGRRERRGVEKRDLHRFVERAREEVASVGDPHERLHVQRLAEGIDATAQAGGQIDLLDLAARASCHERGVPRDDDATCSVGEMPRQDRRDPAGAGRSITRDRRQLCGRRGATAGSNEAQRERASHDGVA
jgi:hypothetical protein